MVKQVDKSVPSQQEGRGGSGKSITQRGEKRLARSVVYSGAGYLEAVLISKKLKGNHCPSVGKCALLFG